MVNNEAVKDCFKLIDGRVYYFDSFGRRLENADYNGHYFGSEGYIDAEFDSLIIDGNLYFISYGVTYNATEIRGKVYSSDHDLDQSNNNALSGVSICYEALGQSFNTVTDAAGNFILPCVPTGSGRIVCTLDGYYTLTLDMNLSGQQSIALVMERSVSITLGGKVVKADSDTNLSNNSPLSGVEILLEKITGSEKINKTTYTDSNGSYSFTDLREGVYTLTASLDGFVSVTQTVQIRYNQLIVTNTAIEMISNATEPGYASGYIKEARYGNYVSGLTVYIYPGINNHYGDYLYVTTTNSSGYFSTEALAPGNYTAYIVDERSLTDETYRYNPLSLPIKVISGTTTQNQNGTVSNGEGISLNGMRMVLTWGADPSDLDSYLRFNGNTLYYANRNIGNCSLDTDDVTGYGPETVTIYKVENYTYNYYIKHCSGNGSIATSSACVTIYFGNDSSPAYVIYPPEQSGRFWNIFTYNAVTGEFVIHNSITDSPIG
jgi:hypothetical protein